MRLKIVYNTRFEYHPRRVLSLNSQVAHPGSQILIGRDKLRNHLPGDSIRCENLKVAGMIGSLGERVLRKIGDRKTEAAVREPIFDFADGYLCRKPIA